jgi:hypothetical protein
LNTQKAVVDTNVLIVANCRSNNQASLSCEEACIDTLVQVHNSRRLALDAAGDILSEYSRGCNFKGQPGAGDEFFRWAFDSRYSSCFLVELTPHGDRVYEEFPDLPELSTFDRDDRMFVATALGCDPTAVIFNAVDSDYTHSAAGLTAIGVAVSELCPDCLRLNRAIGSGQP